MQANESSKIETVGQTGPVSRSRFGGPVTVRTSFILTIVFDFSLLMIAATIGSVVWGF